MCFFFQAEDGIRDLVRSRGLGDVYKRQPHGCRVVVVEFVKRTQGLLLAAGNPKGIHQLADLLRADVVMINRQPCLLYTSDAADERSSVDLGGRRIIKKTKKHNKHTYHPPLNTHVRHSPPSNNHY